MDQHDDFEMSNRAPKGNESTFVEVETRTRPTKLKDEQSLIRLGKKPVLKRTFGFMSILGFSCTVLITWETILITLGGSLTNGGTAGLAWSFLIDWIGTASTYLVMSELASMAPTAGGQYHWVALLSPTSMPHFLSYVVAWMTVTGWLANAASTCYLQALLVQTLIVLANPNHIPLAWQSLLLYWLVIAIGIFVNTVTSRTLARFEGMILILHLFGFFAILIPLVYYSPHGDASVFTTFLNEGGWSTQTLSFFVGMPVAVYAVFGGDSAVHMSEEIRNASVAVPQAIMLSILLNGTLGFGMVIAVVFCIGDVQEVLQAEQTVGYAFVAIFQNNIPSNGGVIAMTLLLVLLGAVSSIGVFATASRMTWSFARDGGMPQSKRLSKLDSRTLMPVFTLALTAVVALILSFITLGSSVAFNDFVSLGVAALSFSYLLTCSLLLWRRCTGGVRPRDDSAMMTGPSSLRWGPWRVPEPLGTINNALAILYLVLVFFWAFWPPGEPVTAPTMNFSILIFGVVLLFSVAWYMIRARKYFRGPIIEIG